jgi:hypothetical protein
MCGLSFPDPELMDVGVVVSKGGLSNHLYSEWRGVGSGDGCALCLCRSRGVGGGVSSCWWRFSNVRFGSRSGGLARGQLSEISSVM